jgi:uncharacterized protein
MKNIVRWFEIPAVDLDRAAKFYSEILGQEVKVTDFMGQSYGFFPMEDMEGVGGDIEPAGKGNAPSSKGTRVYFNCDGKLDEVLARVEKAGGKTVMPKTSIGEAGWKALVEDTEGNVIGLHSAP